MLMIRWTRRRWLATHVYTVMPLLMVGRRSWHRGQAVLPETPNVPQPDVTPWHTLVQTAIDAARTAGARYADARLTRTVVQRISVSQLNHGDYVDVTERVGLGIRTLVNGYWGFSASAILATDEAVRVAHESVSQAQEGANGPPWTVDLGSAPIAAGVWQTPVRIDPFTISFEEKQDFLTYWYSEAHKQGLTYFREGGPSWLQFVRQERVVATSEGALFTQTVYESGGVLLISEQPQTLATRFSDTSRPIAHLFPAGAGWERILDADIPSQIPAIRDALRADRGLASKPFVVGEYTVVCDGATMAELVDHTLGVVTQLDRALGYEANANGTTYLDDPLAMLGHGAIAAPAVTLTADRSTPGDLATVGWDEEGVAPTPFTLIHQGTLMDFQTTREQAAWLAPYYTAQGRPVVSHGCAACEDAHGIPLQQPPNLTLLPNPSDVHLDDLIADVADGLLIERGSVTEVDFQARTGILIGTMREIKQGRLGKAVTGGALSFTAPTLWRQLATLGGISTRQTGWHSQFTLNNIEWLWAYHGKLGKGDPPQRTSRSVHAVAAILPNQALIDPTRKA